MNGELPDVLGALMPRRNSPPLDPYMTVPEAARTARMNAAVLRRWIREGRVQAFRLGSRTYRVRLSDILKPINQEER